MHNNDRSDPSFASPTPDVAAVAAGLSEAQQRVLDIPRGVLTNSFYAGRAHVAARALVGIGLLIESTDKVGNPVFRLTPLGLAVRARLLSETSRGE